MFDWLVYAETHKPFATFFATLLFLVSIVGTAMLLFMWKKHKEVAADVAKILKSMIEVNRVLQIRDNLLDKERSSDLAAEILRDRDHDVNYGKVDLLVDRSNPIQPQRSNYPFNKGGSETQRIVEAVNRMEQSFEILAKRLFEKSGNS